MKIQTLAVHAGYKPDTAQHSCQAPIYASSAFTFDSLEDARAIFALEQPGNIYTRLSNPTCNVLEERVAALEGGVAAVSFASGQSAITALIATLAQAGQNFVTSNSLYGGTATLFRHTLTRFGITPRYFDTDRTEELEQLIDANTRFVYIESVANPRNNIPDFDRIAEIAHKHGVPVVVDNTVLSPAIFRPIEHGADVIIHSASKYLGGHGAHIAGILVDCGTFDWMKEPQRWPQFCAPAPTYNNIVFAQAVGKAALAAHVRTHWLRDSGPCLSPFGAFVVLLGVETLPLRMAAHVSNAQKLAEYLEQHPAILSVNYPGLKSHPDYEKCQKFFGGKAGAIIGIRIKAGYDAAVKFVSSLKLCYHLVNIGDAKTLVSHSASTTHGQLTPAELEACGISPDFIRISVGIEDYEDIRADIEQALKGI